MKFYQCEKCGKIVAIVQETSVPTICCGEAMKELIPGVSDGAVEKHVPVSKVLPGKLRVDVGSVPHPMTENHFIGWVALETGKGCQCVALAGNGQPAAEFALLEGDKPRKVYAYCNLHGLWQAEIP